MTLIWLIWHHSHRITVHLLLCFRWDHQHQRIVERTWVRRVGASAPWVRHWWTMEASTVPSSSKSGHHCTVQRQREPSTHVPSPHARDTATADVILSHYCGWTGEPRLLLEFFQAIKCYLNIAWSHAFDILVPDDWLSVMVNSMLCTSVVQSSSKLQNSRVCALYNKDVMFSVASVCLCVFLSVCLLAALLKRLRTDWDEILRRDQGWWQEQVVKFWWWSGSPCWLPSRKFGHYSKSYERIAKKFYGGVRGAKRDKFFVVIRITILTAQSLRNLATTQFISEFWWKFQDSSAMI